MKNIRKRFVVIYIVAIGSVFLLTLVSQGVIQTHLTKQGTDASVINLSGRQRMLGQQITKLSLLAYQDPEDKVFEDLSQVTKTWMEVHVALQKGSNLLRLPACKDAKILKAFEGINEPFEKISAAALQIAEPGMESTEINRLSRIILANEGVFLKGMDQIVAMFETSANEKVTRLKFIEMLLSMFTILALLVEGFFIFRPMVSHLEHYYTELVASNAFLNRSMDEVKKVANDLEEQVKERKKVEKELIAAKEKAEAAAKAKQQFLAAVSHELRTPLNAINGLTTYLLEEKKGKSDLESLRAIAFSGSQLQALISDILDITKIDEGRIGIAKTNFSPNSLFTDIARAMHPFAKQKGLNLTYSDMGGLPAVLQGDPVRLGQIVNNLLNNAIKFTPTGEITLQTKGEEVDEQNLWIHIFVKDTGIGIPQEQRARIFEWFSQGHDGIANQFGGTGLGLAITKGLVSLMKGKIELESEEGKGTTFKISIPFPIPENQQENSDGKESLPTPKSQTLEDIKVLLVEDNKMNQLVVKKYFSGKDIELEIAENGREAIEKAKNQVFDIILMDLQMPEMDGYEATRSIRKQGVDTPILALTATAFEEFQQEAISAGMNDFITKPFTPAELQQLLAKHLKKPISG